MTIQVTIDHDRCTGHGRCYVTAPDLFTDDDEGYGHVVGDGVVPVGAEEVARKAAASCPERAVSIDS